MAKSVAIIFEKPIYLSFEPVDPHLFASAFGAVSSGAQIKVILRSAAVNYAVTTHDMSNIRIAGMDYYEKVTDPSNAIRFLLKNKAEVHAVKEDLEALGINPQNLVEGVKVTPEKDVAGIVDSVEAVMVW